MIQKIKKVRKYHGHTESYKFDTIRKRKLVFDNNETEEVSVDSPEHIYKFLNTKGSSGDSGYIRGTNEKICNEIDTIMLDMKK